MKLLGFNIILIIIIIIIGCGKLFYNPYKDKGLLYSFPSVTETQVYLQSWGYYLGEVDGIVGPKFKQGYESYSFDYEEWKKGNRER